MAGNNRMKELDEKRKKDICRCEDERCSDTQLSHFEKCSNCGSTSYHITIKIFEEEVEVNETREDTGKYNFRY